MKNELNTICILALSFLLLFSIAELLHRYLKIKAELSRKFVHTGTGFLTLLFPLLLRSHWSVLLLCSSFAFILLLSLKYKLLPSINAIGRKSYGSLTYPLSVYVCFLLFAKQNPQTVAVGNSYTVFYLPILILAICDPLAALCGKRWPYGRYHIRQETKTLIGSGCFFLAAFLISFMLLRMPGTTQHAFFPILTASVLIALVSTTTEALSTKGTDNLFIPLTSSVALYLTSFLFH